MIEIDKKNLTIDQIPAHLRFDFDIEAAKVAKHNKCSMDWSRLVQDFYYDKTSKKIINYVYCSYCGFNCPGFTDAQTVKYRKAQQRADEIEVLSHYPHLKKRS